MQKPIDLTNRLALLRIQEDTKGSVEIFRPYLWEHLPLVIDRFYRHLMSFPEGRQIIGGEHHLPRLKDAQEKHWKRLFSCEFDHAYAESAMTIGRAHLRAGVAPYLYIAGYSFFTCELVRIASDAFSGDLQLTSILTSIQKVISLDMDLALSAYTRELWRAKLAGGH